MIAFYLPQFHTFPENDEWWGKGFTEWVNVKKSKPLFKGHNQPRTPYKENYYDLSLQGVLEDQMDMARNYGIYGFCYYHYWFNGRLLMEKPLERMLGIKDKIPFCFCWANEPWTRAWDGLTGQVIMPQEYGEEEDWEKHFNYLLPFFMDDKYIKVDNCPMFVIYNTIDIVKADEMLQYMDKRCRESGFKGLYTVEEYNTKQRSASTASSKAILDFEPMYTVKYGRTVTERIKDKLIAKLHNAIHHQDLLIYSYDKVWKAILNRELTKQDNHMESKKRYLGGFVDWDNSPRRGDRALIIKGANPEKFGRYMKKQVERCIYSGSEYLFINAWNEWAESTYLEPDEKNGYAYLEKIKQINNV